MKESQRKAGTTARPFEMALIALNRKVTESCYNQLQKYLRHCTVFWLKWSVHDLVLVIPPPPLIKVASNKRPWRNNFEWEGGGRSLLYLSDMWLAAIWSKKGRFFRRSVSTFLQLVVALLGSSNFKNIRHVVRNQSTAPPPPLPSLPFFRSPQQQIISQKHCPQRARLFEAGQWGQNEIKMKANHSY